MIFTAVEYGYLEIMQRGRLASIGPDGTPQVHPVSFVVDPKSEDVVIVGRRLRDSEKYRNVRRDPRVSLTVGDDPPAGITSAASNAPGIEIRGFAEASEQYWPLNPELSNDIIRIRPIRVDSWNIDGQDRRSRFVS
jgi:pyridoxamine 5'-phosphate oxidase family protein